MLNQEVMTIEDLEDQFRVIAAAIRSHLNILKHEGVYEIDVIWPFPPGTRCAFFPRKSELESTEKTYRAILRATSEWLFVYSVMLDISGPCQQSYWHCKSLCGFAYRRPHARTCEVNHP